MRVMITEQIEQTFKDYETVIKKLTSESRELQAKIRDYENIVFALKSVLEIASK